MKRIAAMVSQLTPLPGVASRAEMKSAVSSSATAISSSSLAAFVAAQTSACPLDIIRINPNAPLQPCGAVNETTLIEGTTASDLFNEHYSLICGAQRDASPLNFNVGIWSCTPCKEFLRDTTGSEFCYIIKGKCTLQALPPDSSVQPAQTFIAGDAFIIPRGIQVLWHTQETVTKMYVRLDVYQPPTSEALPSTDK